MAAFLDQVWQRLGWCPRIDSREYPPGIHARETARGRPPGSGPDAAPCRAALILLLPLMPAAVFVAYSLLIPVLLPSAEIQMAVTALVIGVPAAVIILYGRTMHDPIGSALTGALLYSLFGIYAHSLGLFVVPGSMRTPVVHWFTGSFLAGMVLFVGFLGAMGFSASRRTDRSLLAAVALAALVSAIVWGIG